MRSIPVVLAVTVCLVASGCTTMVGGTAVDADAPDAPVMSAPLDQVLPTAAEMGKALGSGLNGFMGQLVEGGADMLLQGVNESDASPVECISATYRLQQATYRTSPVRSVASRSWAGGDFSGPPVSAFFGAVTLATPQDALSFFAAAADKWRRCDGQTMVLHQAGLGGSSTISDVVVGERTVSAVVTQSSAGGAPVTVQRAMGVAANCIVDVEITDATGPAGAATEAVTVAEVMLGKIG
jgi:hypothetical protein